MRQVTEKSLDDANARKVPSGCQVVKQVTGWMSKFILFYPILNPYSTFFSILPSSQQKVNSVIIGEKVWNDHLSRDCKNSHGLHSQCTICFAFRNTAYWNQSSETHYSGFCKPLSWLKIKSVYNVVKSANQYSPLWFTFTELHNSHLDSPPPGKQGFLFHLQGVALVASTMGE